MSRYRSNTVLPYYGYEAVAGCHGRLHTLYSKGYSFHDNRLFYGSFHTKGAFCLKDTNITVRKVTLRCSMPPVYPLDCQNARQRMVPGPL